MKLFKYILSILVFLILQLSISNNFASVFSNKVLNVSRIEYFEKPISDFSKPGFTENHIFEQSFLDIVTCSSISFCDGYAELVESWKSIKYCGDDELAKLATNLDELDVVAKNVDDIDNLGGYKNWRLRTGRTRHPNWVQVDDIANKVSDLEPHVLRVETKADGTFYPKSKTINNQNFQMDGFKGCHSENALKEYVQANGGTYTVKNKSLGKGGVYEGQPVIYLNNKEYVKINGQFVEYEPSKLGGTSSFFPKDWSNARIKEEVAHAIANNHGRVPGQAPTSNLLYGYSKDGLVEIRFAFNPNGKGTYYPIKN